MLDPKKASEQDGSYAALEATATEVPQWAGINNPNGEGKPSAEQLSMKED